MIRNRRMIQYVYICRKQFPKQKQTVSFGVHLIYVAQGCVKTIFDAPLLIFPNRKAEK